MSDLRAFLPGKKATSGRIFGILTVFRERPRILLVPASSQIIALRRFSFHRTFASEVLGA